MTDHFKTLLLLALPAGGKSEVRNFLMARDPSRFHMAPTVQLDDYPYVHLQIRVDEVLVSLGLPQVYHGVDPGHQGNGPFFDHREFVGLIHLLNDDYEAYRRGRPVLPERPARHLLERFDAASIAVGARPKLPAMSADVIAQIERGLEAEARAHYEQVAAAFPGSLDGSTVVLEFSRGGPPGDTMPLPDGYGYLGSVPHLSREILEHAAILYIWVTPEDSRRKNRERARPDGDGSILFHGTPESVMTREYSRCDMEYLIQRSKVSGAVRIEAHGTTFDVPVARFDNRGDLTTFLRKDQSDWAPEEITAIDTELHRACTSLWATCQKLGK
jgi:hypothetical protein